MHVPVRNGSAYEKAAQKFLVPSGADRAVGVAPVCNLSHFMSRTVDVCYNRVALGSQSRVDPAVGSATRICTLMERRPMRSVGNNPSSRFSEQNQSIVPQSQSFPSGHGEI
jgi:hypothetical protein